MKRVFILLLLLPAMAATAQMSNGVPPKRGANKANKYSSLPSGYTQVGSTQLYYYYRNYSNAYNIDVIGYYNGYYYSSTFSDSGYRLSVKVGKNNAVRVNCLNGTTNNGVTIQPSVVQQGELARMCYTVTNTNKNDVVISLGVYADVMIGNNDHAPISRRIDTVGQTYGLTMRDGNGAQLCVLFGSGLAEVTAVDDYWFGRYNTNTEPSNMVGNYTTGSNWMQENGSYDSGMGWCWKDRTIAAGSSIVFSYLIGVGEVNLEPNSSFEVTPDDPEGWNDLNRPHRLTLVGTYESPAGLDGVIDYAVEESEEWTTITDVLASGESFTASLVATFDPNRSIHIIRLRTRDLVGNTTLLSPIEYKDVSFYPVSGIKDKTYTGDSIYQDNLICELEADQYVARNYRNNVVVGTASFTVEGVFPETIGRKSYTFSILPQPLSGTLVLAETEFVYDGSAFTPDWLFSNANYNSLKPGEDYTVTWTGNRQPGTGTLTVTGKNNYTSSLKANIHIDKAPLADNLFTLTLPEEDITYDGLSHGATVTKQAGVGTATISYQKKGESETTTTKPKNAGNYTIYLEIADGTLYYGRARTQAGTFSIYQFSEEEWSTLQSVLSQLVEMGWSQPWDLSQGVKGVSLLQGLTIEKGHVTSLNLAGQNLTGQFPDKILLLHELKQLNLANNHISSNIDTIYMTFPKLQDMNISNNLFSGNIGKFVKNLTNLKSLNASNNCLEEINPMISPTVTSLDINRQTISRVVPLDLGMASSENYILETLPSILLYDHANRTFSPNINLRLTTQDDSWSMTLIHQNGQLFSKKVSTQNVYYGKSGDVLDVVKYKNNNTLEGSTLRINLIFDEGDSNFDGQLNVLDLQTSLNYMFHDYNNKPFNFTASNLYSDEVVNVQDIVLVVDKLLDARQPNNIKMYGRVRAQKEEAEEGGTDACLYWRGSELILNTAIAVIAADIYLAGDASITWNLPQMGFTVTEKKDANGTHAVIYSLSDAEIPVGETVVAHRDGGSAEPVDAMLSDRQAAPISVSMTASDATTISKLMAVSGDWSILRTDGTVVAQGTGNTQLMSARKHLSTGVYILQRENNNIQKFTVK